MQHCHTGCSTPQQASWQPAGNTCGSSHLPACTAQWCRLAACAWPLCSQRRCAEPARPQPSTAHASARPATMQPRGPAPSLPPLPSSSPGRTDAVAGSQRWAGRAGLAQRAKRPCCSRAVRCKRARTPVERPTRRPWPVAWHTRRACCLTTPGPATSCGNPSPCPGQRRAPGPAAASLTGGRGRGRAPCAGRPPARCARPGARAAPRAARSARRACRRPARRACVGRGRRRHMQKGISGQGAESPGSRNKKRAHGGSLHQGHRQQPSRQRVERGRFRARAAPPP